MNQILKAPTEVSIGPMPPIKKRQDPLYSPPNLGANEQPMVPFVLSLRQEHQQEKWIPSHSVNQSRMSSDQMQGTAIEGEKAPTSSLVPLSLY